MNVLMKKYVEAYHQESGDILTKVKNILVRYGHEWELQADSVIADLIDDKNITADDVVDVLASFDEVNEGNNEFHYAVRALQVCLKKAHLQEQHAVEEEIELDFEANDEEMPLHLNDLHRHFHGHHHSAH